MARLSVFVEARTEQEAREMAIERVLSNAQREWDVDQWENAVDQSFTMGRTTRGSDGQGYMSAFRVHRWEVWFTTKPRVRKPAWLEYTTAHRLGKALG